MLVGRREGEVAEFTPVHPGKVRALDGGRFARSDLAEMESESDRLLGIGVGDLLVQGAHGRDEPEFLLEFAGECRFPRLTLLELASGEFPQAGEVGTRGALGDQEPSVAEDEASGDIDDVEGTHVQGVGLTAGTMLTELVRLAALFSSGLARRRVARRMNASLASCRSLLSLAISS